MKTLRLTMTALAIVGSALYTSTPQKAHCATCVPAACYSSDTCAGDCVCLRSGTNIGQCVGVN